MTESELVKLFEQFEQKPNRDNRQRLVKAMRSIDWSDYWLFRNKFADWLEKNGVETTGE